MTQASATEETLLSSAQAVPTSLLGSKMSLSQSPSSKNLPPRPRALDTARWLRRSQADPAVMETAPAWDCEQDRGAKSRDVPVPVSTAEEGLTRFSTHPGP